MFGPAQGQKVAFPRAFPVPLVLLLLALGATSSLAAERDPPAQKALFLFQRCAGIYYALAQFFDEAGTETSAEAHLHMLADARAAESAAVHFRTQLYRQRNPDHNYDGAQYAEWSASIHSNALTIANQNYYLLRRHGSTVLQQDLVPCVELHQLQTDIVSGKSRR
jgi:hypothetical protein